MTQNEYKQHPGFMAFRGSNTKVDLCDGTDEKKAAEQEQSTEEKPEQ